MASEWLSQGSFHFAHQDFVWRSDAARAASRMYYFAIDLAEKMPYHLAPPQGWEAVSDL